MAAGQGVHSAGTGTKHEQHSEHGSGGSRRSMRQTSGGESPGRELWDDSVAHHGEAKIHVQQRILVALRVRVSGRAVRVFGMEEEAGTARYGDSR